MPAIMFPRNGTSSPLKLSARTAEQARAEILRAHPAAEPEVRRIGLADLASVEEFAGGLVADGRPLDLLLNSAGVVFPPVRHETADGFELQLGSNFLGPFALTVRLPLLLRAPAARVVTMSSGVAARGEIDFGDIGAPAVVRPTKKALDRDVAARLWAEAERLTGVTVPAAL
ncbi:SDR family NAD(P)-dependent oxidoreductase [Nonomuraea rubra]|uniref:NAD(P)-dependent dehydrogenase (Short-subunit alcohol dehydrogenase family) n=1 Tax=Nonomuraea rubra TaxID=46180 RepID=A0A7X0U1T4_9ACTN|nr:SDR family NAD(P)-dependent oxidoreductase [Nonomuraea rubra]MBB6551730.1 NAD(P)-dependent dehydrogenase (short-subunit alcohol dehydrogenase family) [Nonomuraea rubra]